MKEEELIQIFDDIQLRLETLRESEASFLFIGHQGNHFALGGNLIYIGAQILFAMIRYPIVRDLIKECADKYDSAEAQYGKSVRDVKMDHLIELNSGN